MNHTLSRTRHCAIWFWLLSALCHYPSIALSGTLQSGALGAYRFHTYLPANHDRTKPVPLVVVLHGCQQNAVDIMQGTRFNQLADEQGLIVLYPETRAKFGNSLGCWIWWEPQNQRRARGEPGVIVQMIGLMQRKFNIDSTRVYVTGISSGGAMAAILGSIYPDMFAAVGVHSGVAFGAAATGACALSAMRKGSPDPRGRGEIAYHLQGSNYRVVPMILIQGTRDTTVDRKNADRLVTQFAQMNDYADDGLDNDSFDAAADTVTQQRIPGGYEYGIHDFFDNNGMLGLRKVLVTGLGHAWSGGNPAGSYTDEKGPDATRLMWSFFKDKTLQKQTNGQRQRSPCREKRAANFTHFWWHRSMNFKEYLCDPWRSTWRYTFNSVWAPGRCP